MQWDFESIGEQIVAALSVALFLGVFNFLKSFSGIDVLLANFLSQKKSLS